MKNYYRVLGVPQNATCDEVNTAYKMLAQRFDPNKSKGDRYIEERFIDISLAYKTLQDQEKRKDYDRILKSLAIDTTPKIIELKGDNVKKHVFITRWSKAFAGAILLIATASIFIIKERKTDIKQSVELNKTTDLETGKIQLPGKIIAPVTSLPSQKTTLVKPIANANTVVAKKTNRIADSAKKHVAKTAIISKKKKDIKQQEAHTNAIPETPVLVATHYAAGDSKKEILGIQGTPSMITKYNDNSEVWHYGKSKLYFMNGKLKSYYNGDGNLMIKAE